MPPSEADYARPDRELVVKATFDRWNKRIRFGSARNCSFTLLRTRVEQCFQLSQSQFSIAYKDDDGEVTDITCDADLDEAVQYFQAGVDDLPVSSAHSILSGRSFGSRKITMRVNVTVDFDGRLSDTSSLASLEEFRDRNGSEYSLSFGSAVDVEPEDDQVTISSRDTSQLAGKSHSGRRIGSWKKRIPSAIPGSLSLSNIESEVEDEALDARSIPDATRDPYPEDPSAVFERLKYSETTLFGTTEATDRRAQWLRDQRSGKIIGDGDSVTTESVSDVLSLSFGGDFEKKSSFNGDLALEQDNSGKYYYAYRSSSSSASQLDPNGELETNLRWFASQQTLKGVEPSPKTDTFISSGTYPSTSSSSRPSSLSINSEEAAEVLHGIHPDIPPEVLNFIDHCPPPTECTHCSECGASLESFRYVCSTCGETKPGIRLDPMPISQMDFNSKGKQRDVSEFDPLAYPPPKHRSQNSPSPASSVSSWTLLAGEKDKDNPFQDPPSIKERSRPLPKLPLGSPSPSSSSSSPPTSSKYSPSVSRSSSLTSMSISGYELCVSCIERAGVLHAAAFASIKAGSDQNHEPSSPEELSQWTRLAPKEKGHFRHAFLEKVWGPGGWQEVEHTISNKCSTCSRALSSQKFKCASCENIVLCVPCYSQVHEIHPRHAFLAVMQKLPEVVDEAELQISQLPTDDGLGEQSLAHPGVKCAHCLQDIVGALYHCAACEARGESVDICSNCEAAGLPGNLDAPDGGHSSSHIMIKIPVPMKPAEVQAAGRRALQLWCERDAPQAQRVNGHLSRRNSLLNADIMTVVDSKSSRSVYSPNSTTDEFRDHKTQCNRCRKNIYGLRYQCATCPSSPNVQYNLCAQCEERSYEIHDPMHIFFKIQRPVARPIESQFGLLPLLYKEPVGVSNTNSQNPKEYLGKVEHKTTLCDCCMEHIRGEWFRCAYCSKDLCSFCEKIDEHDKTHLFFVFKAPVDMRTLRIFARLDSNEQQPVLKYPVYFS